MDLKEPVYDSYELTDESLAHPHYASMYISALSARLPCIDEVRALGKRHSRDGKDPTDEGLALQTV